jgi:3(or 17)beta-hydroxysteroid dehydrogenase
MLTKTIHAVTRPDYSMPKLANRRALVTGGARGIGAAIARIFAGAGAVVIIADIDGDAGMQTARDIGSEFIELDVASEQSWIALTAKYPAIDIMVNNAGITGFEHSSGPHDPEHASLEE